MQASKEVTSNRLILTSSCSRPCMDLRSGIGLGVARLLGVRLPERAVPFVRRRYAAAETVRASNAMLRRSRRGGGSHVMSCEILAGPPVLVPPAAGCCARKELEIRKVLLNLRAPILFFSVLCRLIIASPARARPRIYND